MTLNIRPHMKRSGLTQVALAEMVGISPGYLSELLSGKKNPSLDTLEKLAAALSCRPGELHATPPVPRPAPGMAEDAADFARPIDSRAPLQPAPGNGEAAFSANRSALAFGILKGDVLFLGLGEKPVTGNLVLASESDAQGSATSFVALYANGALLPENPMDGARRPADGGSIAVMGVIRRLWRDLSPLPD